MKKHNVITILSVLMVVVLTGCNKKSADISDTADAGQASQVREADAGTNAGSATETDMNVNASSDAGSDAGSETGSDADSDKAQTADQSDLQANAPDSGNTEGDSLDKSMTDDQSDTEQNAYDDIYGTGFYGIWISGVKDRDVAIADAQKLNDAGFDSYVCFSPEWEDMNQDEYYCVTSGRYTTKEAAEDELETVKKEGYGDAYIKFTGPHKYTMMDYTNFGDLEMEINEDNVILKDVRYSLSRAWYADMEAEYISDLVIDKQSVFDEKCEMQFFGNYNEGDEPLEWVKTNYDLMINESDLYISNGPALSGVFEVGITGNHIDRYFGSYWWD